MTPYSLAFYLDVITSATVLGVRPSATPDQVTAVLGDDFAENSADRRSMWRDYGMAEFFWHRDSANAPWEGHHFTLQVHRLAGGDSRTVNDAIRAEYGRFDRRLRFAKVRRLLERRGVPLVELPDPANSPHYRRFWQPDSQVSVSVIGTREEFLTPSRLRTDDVYAISGSVPSPVSTGR
ncbi:hypothetical protein [Streptomyces sp. NPDC059063]|uniref:hypothetical protein n=1 Tax=unclassified Streptomyces TaxID=2593676 RepID=UPI0036ABCA36